MRKNIFNTVAGLLVAVSMLFAAIGCTNINDPETLKNDSFTVNKMAIAGFKVTGLDGVFDHATVQLKGADDAVIAEGFIADDDDDLTPGSAFVKLETPYIFDAGENSPKDFECYLEVVKSGVKLADIKAVDPEDLTAVANAKLPIIPSPYGTKDADLAKRYVDVQVSNGVGTFSFSEDLSASLRFSYTSLGSHDWAEISTADWATVTSVAKTDATYAKYKITINNLEKDEDGMRYILAGSTIAPLNDKSKAGDYWYGNAKDEGKPKLDAFISEVEDGTITFEFYAGGASFNASAGCAIKISAVDDPMKSDPWLCLLTGPKGDNLFLPIDKDYTVVIDAKKANADYVASEIGDRCFNIAGVKVISDKLTGADDVYFLSNWLPGNEWDATSPNKVLAKDVDADSDSATFEFTTPIKVWAGEADTFRTFDPVQVIQFTKKTDFWDKDNKIVTEDVKIRAELAEYIGTTCTLVLDMTADPQVYLDVWPVTIKSVRVINADVKDGTKIYFLDGDLIGSSIWNETETTTATMTDGKATFNLSSPKVMKKVSFGCQIVYIKEGESTFGDKWKNVIKIANENVKVDNLCDKGTYVLEFDAVANTFALKAE